MSNRDLERLIRRVVYEELRILAPALGGPSAANTYAIGSFREEQERESSALPVDRKGVRP